MTIPRFAPPSVAIAGVSLVLLNKNATRFPGRCGDARPAAREGEIAALKVPEDAPQPGKATRQIPWGLIGGGERRFYFSFGLEPTTDLVVAPPRYSTSSAQ